MKSCGKSARDWTPGSRKDATNKRAHSGTQPHTDTCWEAEAAYERLRIPVRDFLLGQAGTETVQRSKKGSCQDPVRDEMVWFMLVQAVQLRRSGAFFAFR